MNKMVAFFEATIFILEGIPIPKGFFSSTRDALGYTIAKTENHKLTVQL